MAAAACVFLIASAVIAFKGWPGTGFTDRIDNLFVTDHPPVAWDKPGTTAVAAGAGTAAAAVAGTAAGPTFGTAGVILGNNGATLRGGAVRLPDGSLVSTGPSGPGTIGTPSPGSGTSIPPLPVNPGPTQGTLAGTVQQTGSTVGNTVRNTTGTVGNGVGGPAGNAVKQTGNTVGDTVDNTTKAVGGLLKP